MTTTVKGIKSYKFASRKSMLAMAVAAAMGANLDAVPSQAGILYWRGGTSTGSWDNGTTSNWATAPAVAPSTTWASASDAHFNGTAGAVTVSGNITSVNSITLDTDGYTLSSGTITLTGSGSITTGAGSDTINSIIAGSVGLTKLGTGTLTLGGSNTYSGATTASAGNLVFGAGSSITTNTASSIIAAGGTLTIAGGSVTGNNTGTSGLQALEIGAAGGAGTVNVISGSLTAVGMWLAGGTANAGTFTQSGGTVSITGQINAAQGAASSISVSGGSFTQTANTLYLGVSATGTLNVSGTGLVNLQNLQLGFGGSTSIVNLNGGTLTLSGLAYGSGSSSINFNGGTLQYAGSAWAWPSTSVAVTTAGPGGATIDSSTFSPTISSAITGNGGLTKLGIGTLSLTGSSSYSGGTTISAGALGINNASAIGTGTLTLSGGNINNSSGAGITLSNNNPQAWNSSFTFVGSNALNLGTGAVTLGVTPTITVSANILTVGGAISGGFGLTKAGAGSLTLSGSGSNTYTGVTSLTQGTMALSKTGGAVAVPGNITVSDTNSTLIYATQNNQFAAGSVMSFSGTAANFSRFELDGTTQTLAGISDSDAVGVIENSELGPANSGAATLVLNGSGTYSFNGFLRSFSTGTVALAMSGIGTQTLSGASINYTGGTTISNGTLQLAGTTAFASTSTVNASGTLAINGNGTNVIIPAAGTITLNGGTLNSNENSGYVVLSGPINLNANSTISTTGTGTASFNSLLFNSGGLFSSTPVTLTLNASTINNGMVMRAAPGTFNGAIIVNGQGATPANRGNLQMDTAAAATFVNADMTLNNATWNIGLDANSDVNTAGTNYSAKSLSGNGFVVSDSRANTLTLGTNNGTGSFSGNLGNGTGTLTLVKTGAGTQTLSGTNTYTGGTTISNGTLLVTNTTGSGTGTGLVTVNGNASVGSFGTLGGTGTITGGVTLATNGATTFALGAVLNPGTVGTAGTLAINTAGLTTNNFSNLNFDLNTAQTVGSGTNDLISTNVLPVINATTRVNINALGTLTPGLYTLANGYSGTLANFSNLSLNTTFSGDATHTGILENNSGALQLLVTGLTPTTAVWAGAIDANWNTQTNSTAATNWRTTATSGTDTFALPGSITDVTFSTTSPVAANTSTALGQNFSINSLTFNSATGVTGNTLTLGSSGTAVTVASSVNVTINSAVALGNSQSWSVGTGGSLTVGGSISGAGFGLTNIGAGKLILGGANTFSGGLTISAGTVSATAGTTSSTTSGIGAVNNAISVASGGTLTLAETTGLGLMLGGNITGAGTVNQNDSSSLGVRLAGNNSGFSGTYVQQTSTRFLMWDSGTAGSAAAKWTLNASTSSPFAAAEYGTQAGEGLTASGVTPFASGTSNTINLGELSSTSTTINLGNFTATAGQTANTTFSVGALNTNSTFAGIITNTVASSGAFTSSLVSLTKVGTGTLTFTGANTYTGGTTVNAGRLVLNSSTAFNVGILHGTATVNNGGTLQVVSSGFPVAVTDAININGGGALVVTGGTTQDTADPFGTLNLSSANGTAATISTTDNSRMRFAQGGNGLITSTGAAANTISANIELVNQSVGNTLTVTAATSNTLNITGAILDYTTLTGTPVIFNGAGTVNLSGANSYSGGTTVSNGTLNLVNASSIFASATTVGAATFGLTGTTNDNFGFALTLNNGATLNKTNSGYDTFNTTNVTLSGNTSINITNNGASNQLFIGGTGTGLTGSGTLTITNTGTATTGLTLRTGVNVSHFNGAMIINGGALNFGTGAGLALDNTDLTLTGATMSIDGLEFATGAATAASVKSLTGNSASSVILAAQTLTLGTNNGTGIFAGVISGTGGALIKTGTGTETLNGANLYTGGTTVTGGKLVVANTTGSATGTGTVTVASGGILAGSASLGQGIISGVVNVNNNGTLGASSGASLTLTGNLSFAGGSNANFALGTPNNTSNALVKITGGTFTASSTTLNFTTPQSGTYDLFGFTGTLPSLSSFTIGTGLTGLSYALQTGTNQIDLIIGSVGSSAWNGASTVNSNWSNPTNWVSTTVPGLTSGTTSTDTATFNAAPTVANNGTTNAVVVDANRNVQSIAFSSASPYVVGATGLNALLLTNGGSISSTSTNTETVNTPLVLEGANATYAFTNNSTSATNVLNIGGGITGGAVGNTTLTLNGSNTGANTISGVIGNGLASVSVYKDGAGTWILGASNTYNSGTTINAGTLQTGNSGALGTVGVTFSSGSGTLALAATGGSQTYSNTIDATNGGNISISGALAATVGDVTVGAGDIDQVTNTTLTLTSPDTSGNSYSLTVGVLNLNSLQTINVANSAGSGAGQLIVNGGLYDLQGGTNFVTLTKTGAGTLTIAADSTIADGEQLVITQGVVQANSTNALGTSGFSLLATISTGGTLSLGGPGSAVNVAALADGTGSGSVLLNGKTLQLGNTLNTNYSSFSGVIADGSATGGGLVVSGSGFTQNLAGQSTYTGPTAISGSDTLQNGIANALPTTTDLTITGGSSTFDLNSHSQTVNTLNGSGNVSNTTGGSATFTVSNGGTFSGAIAGSNLALNVSGGTLILNGSSNSVAAVSVGGTLLVGDASNPSASLTSTGVTVNSGGILGGHGTITGPVTVSTGGQVQPGGSIGTLTIAGAYTQGSNTFLGYILDDPTSGDYSMIDVTGGLLTIGTGVEVDVSGTLDVGTYHLFTYGTDGLSGTTTGWTAVGIPGGDTYSFSTLTNHEVDLIISPMVEVPEPTSLGLLGFGALALLGRKRRRGNLG